MGTVEDITLRNIKIRLLNNALAYVPNLKITTSSVSNFSKIENRRIDFVLQFPLDITAEKLHRIMSKLRIYLENHPKIVKQTITIALTTLSTYSKDMRIFFYINESKFKKYLEMQEDVNFKIMEILNMENVQLAKPTQILEFKENLEDVNEIIKNQQLHEEDNE